jgi:hypothetical protein
MAPVSLVALDQTQTVRTYVKFSWFWALATKAARRAHAPEYSYSSCKICTVDHPRLPEGDDRLIASGWIHGVGGLRLWISVKTSDTHV